MWSLMNTEKFKSSKFQNFDQKKKHNNEIFNA